MMTKEPLDFDRYKDYEIDPRNVAYVITYENLTMTRAGEIEDELTSKRFKIVNSELESQFEGKYRLVIIVVEPVSFTF